MKCGRCEQWFKREVLEEKEIKEKGKVKEYLCPECDREVQEESND